MTRKALLFMSVLVVSLESGLRVTGLYTTFSENSTGRFWFEWEHERDSYIYAFPPNQSFDMDIGDTVFQYVINELGYRERPMPATSSPKSQRVFIVGDSFTEGNGAEYGNSWVRRLESLVKAQYPSAEFYVCGISGLDPHFAWVTIKEQLLAYRPTHIITSVNDSDFDDQIIRGGYSRFKEGGRVKYNPSPSFLKFYKYSHIVRLIVHEFLSYDHYLIRRNTPNVQRLSVADSIATCLGDINLLCAENDVKFLSVIHPVPHMICYESESSKSEVVAFESVQFDFPVVKMYAPLKSAMEGDDCTSYHWKQDSHFNGKGYKLFGNLIFEEIEQKYPDFWNYDQQPDSKSAAPSK